MPNGGALEGNVNRTMIKQALPMSGHSVTPAAKCLLLTRRHAT